MEMACIRVSLIKSLPRTSFTRNLTSGAVNPSIIRPLSSILGNRGDFGCASQSRTFSFEPRSGTHQGFPPTLLRSHVGVGCSLLRMGPASGFHLYSSVAGGKGGEKGGLEGVGASRTSNVEVGRNGDGIGGSVNEWMDKVKDVWQSVTDAVAVTGEKVKEVSNEVVPYAQQVVDSHPYVRDIAVPVGGTLTATLMAWVVFPWLLKRLHKYSTKGTAVLLRGSVFSVEIPYEKSIWGAIEDPVRYLTTFMAFSEICYLVAPNAVSQFIGESWKGAVVLSFVWFLQRWKTNLFARALGAQNVQLLDRETLPILDRVTSVGLFAVGVMALAEACGVAVQSILTVGGIGGVATAFAAKDILGNVLSGLSMQFSKPFSLGDTIRAGSVEGQVVEMGLTTTSLLNAEKFPVIVPNSMFSSQVIVNKSRAQWRAIVNRIPLQFQNLENIPEISNDIKSMLKSNPNVFLGKEAPYCYLTRIDTSYAELTLGCNLKHLSKEEHYTTEQDILLQSIQIIKQHGASLGSSS